MLFVGTTCVVFARVSCYTPQHVRHVFAVGRKKGPLMPPHAPGLGQRYVRFTDHLRRMFGCRVHKVSIDACRSPRNSSKASAFCGNVMERKNSWPTFKPTPIPMVTYRYSRASTTKRWLVRTSSVWPLAHAPTVCLRRCWIS